MRRSQASAWLFVFSCTVAGCSAGAANGSANARASTGSTGSGGSANLNVGGASNSGASTSLNLSDASPPDMDAGDSDNPETCAEAASLASYVGCDFWPTIVANPVWTEFTPAVVIANGSMTPAELTIDGPSGFHQTATVAPGGLQTVMLAWVPDLKGPEFSETNTSGGRLTNSVRVNGGSFHMTSTAPVTAWQFNPLDYTHPAGGACPPNDTMGCLSASVDASLLLPSTAMTKNYRIFAYSSKNEGSDWGSVPGGAAITATQDNTMVTVQLGPKCGAELFPTANLGTCVAAGTGVDAKNANDVFTLAMNAGDVVELVGEWAQYPQTKNADLSGSVVNATAPVQVISFNAIAQLPDASIANADHMEETVLPAEVLGKKYIVVPPTTPTGNSVGHVVRIYGNVDGTHLAYSGTKPAGAPDTINAGDMVQIPPLPTGQPAPACSDTAQVPDNCMVSAPFIVEGDQPFAVASFMVGGTLQMPGSTPENSQGDPSMTMEVTPQQFRKQYTFLAPKDYLENFADVLVPTGAQVTLDGAPLAGAPTPIDADWGFVRAPLSNAGTGVHTLSTTNTNGLGLQVEGFGYATSYYYPGGLNLIHISAPPVITVVK